MFTVFKKLYEGCWKPVKDYIKTKNFIYFLPTEILECAVNLGIIKNIDVWNNMIIDFNIMTDEDFVTVRDELYYRLKEIYIPEIVSLQKYFEEKYIKIGSLD